MAEYEIAAEVRLASLVAEWVAKAVGQHGSLCYRHASLAWATELYSIRLDYSGCRSTPCSLVAKVHLSFLVVWAVKVHSARLAA